MSGERIILEFRALPSDVAAPIRVRHLLKRALRSYGLECIRVVGLPDSWDATTPARAPTRPADRVEMAAAEVELAAAKLAQAEEESPATDTKQKENG